MVEEKQPSMVFWIVIFLVVALMFFSVVTGLLPKLIRYKQVPSTTQTDVIIGTATEVQDLVARDVCGIWISIDSLSGYSSEVKVKSTLDVVTEAGIKGSLEEDCKTADFSLKGYATLESNQWYNIKFVVKDRTINLEVTKA